jgi:hypothetical protein
MINDFFSHVWTIEELPVMCYYIYKWFGGLCI